MTTAQQVLDVARSQLGVKESPPNSNRQPYGVWYGVNGASWCAMYVSYCFAQAGMPLDITTSRGFSYCPYGMSYFARIGRFGAQPSVGAIAFYGQRGTAEHTGIVESFDANTITTIEGNTGVGNDTNGGEVMRRVRQRNSWILGYGYPLYDTTQPRPVPPPVVTNIGEQMKRIDVTIPIGPDGNGWAPLNQDFNNLVSVFANGPNPDTDGYFRIPVVGAQMRGAGSVITAEGGQPNTNEVVHVVVTGP